MKVTFVVPFVNLTGGIRVLFDYANWLHDAGHDVTVVYPCWPYQFQYTKRQQWGEFQKHRRQSRVPWFDLRCRLLRVPVIRNRFMPKADLVIATAWPTVHDVARLHPSCGKKVHIVFHHERNTGPERRIVATYRLPYFRIAFSRFVRDSIGKQFDCEVHEVVPNGVDTRLFFPDGDVEEGSVLMLFHPDPRKGADDGLEALSRLRDRMPDVQIQLCGTVAPSRLPYGRVSSFTPTIKRCGDGTRAPQRCCTPAVMKASATAPRSDGVWLSVDRHRCRRGSRVRRTWSGRVDHRGRRRRRDGAPPGTGSSRCRATAAARRGRATNGGEVVARTGRSAVRSCPAKGAS